jgi:hypothetical protein
LFSIFLAAFASDIFYGAKLFWRVGIAEYDLLETDKIKDEVVGYVIKLLSARR